MNLTTRIIKQYIRKLNKKQIQRIELVQDSAASSLFITSMAEKQKNQSTKDFVESLRRSVDCCSAHGGSPLRTLAKSPMRSSRLSSRMPSPPEQKLQDELRRRSRLQRMNRRRSQDDQVAQSQDFSNPYIIRGEGERSDLQLSPQFTLGQQRGTLTREARESAERSFKAKFAASRAELREEVNLFLDPGYGEGDQGNSGYGTVTSVPVPQLLNTLSKRVEQDRAQTSLLQEMSQNLITEPCPTEPTIPTVPTDRSGLTELQRTNTTHTDASKKRTRGKLNQRERPTSKATKYGVIDLNNSHEAATPLTRNASSSFQQALARKPIAATGVRKSARGPAQPGASNSATPQKLAKTASQGIEVYVKKKGLKAGPGHTRANTQLSLPKARVPSGVAKPESQANAPALGRKNSLPINKIKSKKLSSANLKKLDSQASNKRNGDLEKPQGPPDQLSFGERPASDAVGHAHIYPAYKLQKRRQEKTYNDEPLIRDDANGSASFSTFNPAANIELLKNDYVDTFFGTFNSGAGPGLGDGGIHARPAQEQSSDYTEESRAFQSPQEGVHDRHCASRHPGVPGAGQRASAASSRGTSRHSRNKSKSKTTNKDRSYQMSEAPKASNTSRKKNSLGADTSMETRSRGSTATRTNPEKFKDLIAKNLHQQSARINEQNAHSRNDPSVATTFNDKKRKQQSSLDMAGQIQEISPLVADSASMMAPRPSRTQMESFDHDQSQLDSAQHSRPGGEESESCTKAQDFGQHTDPASRSPNQRFNVVEAFEQQTPVRSKAQPKEEDKEPRRRSLDQATQTPGSRHAAALDQEIASYGSEDLERRQKARPRAATRPESSERPTSLGTRHSNRESRANVEPHILEPLLTAHPTVGDVQSFNRFDDGDLKAEQLMHTPRQQAMQRIAPRSNASSAVATPSKRSPHPKSPLESQLIVQEKISPRGQLSASHRQMVAETELSTPAYNTNDKSPLTRRTLTAEMAMQECIEPEASPLRTSRAQVATAEFSKREVPPKELDFHSNAALVNGETERTQAEKAPTSPVSGTPSPSKLEARPHSKGPTGGRAATERSMNKEKNAQQVRQKMRTMGSKDTRRSGNLASHAKNRSSVASKVNESTTKPQNTTRTDQLVNRNLDLQLTKQKSSKRSGHSAKREKDQKAKTGTTPPSAGRPSSGIHEQDVKAQEAGVNKTQQQTEKNADNTSKEEPLRVLNEDSGALEEVGPAPGLNEKEATDEEVQPPTEQLTPNQDRHEADARAGVPSAFEDQSLKDGLPASSELYLKNAQLDLPQMELMEESRASSGRPEQELAPATRKKQQEQKTKQDQRRERSAEVHVTDTPGLVSPLLETDPKTLKRGSKVSDALDQHATDTEPGPGVYEPPEVLPELPDTEQLSDYAKQRKIAYAQVPVIGLPYRHSMPTKRPSQSKPDLEKDCHHHKMILLGDENVGKTSLLLRYMYHAPQTRGGNLLERSSSAAAYVFSRATETAEGIKQFNMWDISYKDGFIQNIKEYYDRTESACVVFDVTDQASFEECKRWASEMKDIAKKVLVVANKIDLEGARVVSKEDAEEFARLQGFSYFEVSASLNVGLDELFLELESDGQTAPTPQPDMPKKSALPSPSSWKQEEISLQLASLNFECDMRILKDTSDTEQPYFRHHDLKTKQEQFCQLESIEEFLPILASIKERLGKLLEEAQSLAMSERPEYIEALEKEKEIEDVVDGLDELRESEGKRRRHRCLILVLLFSVLLVAVYGALDTMGKLGLKLPVYHAKYPKKPESRLYKDAQEADADVFAYEAAYSRKVKAGLAGYEKMVQAHRAVMQQNIDDFRKIPRKGAGAFEKQVEGLKKLLAGEQHFSSARLLDAKKLKADGTEVYTLYKQMQTLGITGGEKEQNQILVDKYSLDAFLRQREFLANNLQLAAFDLQNAIKFYKRRAKSPEENLQWLNEQYEFFEGQVDSALRSAEHVVKQLGSLALDFRKQMATLDADALAIGSLQKISRRNGFDTAQRVAQCKAGCQLSQQEICSSQWVNLETVRYPTAAQLNGVETAPDESQLEDRLARISRISSQARDLEKDTQKTASEVSRQVLVGLASRPLSPQEQTLFSQYTLKVCALAAGMRQYDAALAAERARKLTLDEEAASSATTALVIFILSCCVFVLSLAIILRLGWKQIKSRRRAGGSQSTDDVEREVEGLLKPLLH